MPQSRKRHPHSGTHKTPPTSPRQRTRGRIIWSLLFAVFGLTIGFVSTDGNFIAPVAGALLGAAIGFFIGRALDNDARM